MSEDPITSGQVLEPQILGIREGAKLLTVNSKYSLPITGKMSGTASVPST